MGFGFGVLIALLLLVIPGTLIARAGGLRLPTALAVAPALTYGVVAVAIVPFGALDVPWNLWSALLAVALLACVATGVRGLFAPHRHRDRDAETPVPARGPILVVCAGVLLGALLIGRAPPV